MPTQVDTIIGNETPSLIIDKKLFKQDPEAD
jgi:hypothetical protein